jgi:AAA+ superfamily predicted ATPase
MPDDDDKPLSPGDFGEAFRGFMDQMATQAPARESELGLRFTEHLGVAPATSPVVSEDFESRDHANVQMALETYLAEGGRGAEVIGFVGGSDYMPADLTDLISPAGSPMMSGRQPKPGPVQYRNVEIGDDLVVTCVQQGVYLVTDAHERLIVLVRGPSDTVFRRTVKLQVMGRDRAAAERLLADLRSLIRRRNVYRSRVVSLAMDRHDGITVSVHKLPRVERTDIILPEGLLERIERLTIGFAQHQERLRVAGQHVKRGLLFHGPPGTGKTLTAMYLAAQMAGRTVIVLTGRAMGLIEASCAMARTLQPATVILEDVDLIAEERTRPGMGCAPLLFELLNQMDGLADDADILFLLTTNRPDILEPALAARPGRIDQAIEIPTPDAGCRRRLLHLYGRGLTLQIENSETLVDRTQGASAAFMRELIRKAALFAADESADLVVTDRHFEAALHELLVQGGQITRSLLGVRAEGAEQN